MGPIKWSERLATGIKEIDEQHKSLIGIVNRLQATIGSKAGEQALAQLVGELRDYAKRHFDTEEEFMKRQGFPELPAHRLEHLNLTNRVKLIQQCLYKKQPVSGSELLEFVRAWLLDHILKTDMKYVRFVNAKPAQVTVGVDSAAKKVEEA